MRKLSLRKPSLHRFRLGLFVAVGLVGAAVAISIDLAGLMDSQEQSTVDVRFGIRGGIGAPADVRIVRIDDVTFGDLRTRWPFPRRLHAQVIDQLHKAGAKVIAFDVQFTEPTTQRDDMALFNAAGRARNLVFSTTEVNKNGGSDVLGGDANLREVHAVAANALIPTDTGGVIRRFLYRVDGLKSFAATAAERATGVAMNPKTFPKGGAWIDYAGPPGTVPGVSFSRVLQGKFPKDFFRGKVVVVGPTAPSLQDVHPTSASGGELMGGAEVQANAIWTALHGFPLRSTPGWLTPLLLLLLALVAPLATLRFSPFRSLLVAAGAGVLYAVLAQIAFDHGHVLPFVHPLIALAISAVGIVAVGSVLEAFERERMRDLFGRFVPEQVVDEVLAQANDGGYLGGKLRVCTMMFTDLRGFTTFSESRPADEVINILNYYFGEISQAVFDHGGTLVSYLGDGMMSVFGAPLEQEDHVDRAVAAARDILTVRLPNVNEWIREQGYGDGFRMGVGLNSGTIMTGNIGSERRMEYTTIGDPVNTASRLEGMTKGTPFPLFMSDMTRELLREEPDDLVYVAELEVRGRQEKVKVWSLRGLAGGAPSRPQEAPEAVPAIVPST
jgi:adenylate cyclase